MFQTCAYRAESRPVRVRIGELPTQLVFTLILLLFPYFATAQEEDTEESLTLELVRVTGSRIERSSFRGPIPLDVYPRQELQESGAITLGEFFRTLPESAGAVSEGAQGSDFGGSSYIDLRGIGIDNTLTLLNGKRVSAYARNGATEPFVDINAIPVSAIERIEILKDGASAIYGADAVAGVVNVILRKSFDGLELGGGYLTTTEGDGEEWNADLVWGRQYENTHLLLTLSYFNKSPIQSRDRKLTASADFTDQGGPDFRAFNSTPSTYFDLTTFQTIPDPECGIDPNVSGIVSFPFFGDICLFNYSWFQRLTYDTETFGANFTVFHDFSPSLTGRLEAFYSLRENTAQLAPTPVLGGIIPPNHPNNQYGIPVEVFGRPLDTGNRFFDNKADTYRILAGLEGSWDAWDWSADLLFSGNNVKTRRRNAVYSDRYYSALAGMGGESGNLWYSPFGANPQNDPAVIEWMTTNSTFGADTQENALEFEASTLFGELPGGKMGFAAGMQYRQQSLDEFADEIERSGLLAGGSRVTQIEADRDIFALYAEFRLPLHKTLEAQLALRYDHYNDFGSSTNPKVALAWQPSDNWLIRASYSTSFRPPSFTELFNPPVTNPVFLTDVERCEVTGAFPDCAPWEYLALSVGNEDLQPEEGESFFAGFVWSPTFLNGFDLGIDYWQFKHEGRIIALDPQLILDAKRNYGVTRFPPTEEDIALGIPGRIEQVTRTFVNSDELETSGIDVIANYAYEAERAGIFRFSLKYTYVDEYTLTEAVLGSAQADVNYAGKYFNFQFGIPKHRGNLNFNWSRGPHALALNLHYVGEYEGSLNLYEGGVPTDQPLIVDDRTTIDLQYGYVFKNQKTQLQLGCRNCLDKDPPVTFNPSGEGLYDYRGAMVYTRLQHHF